MVILISWRPVLSLNIPTFLNGTATATGYVDEVLVPTESGTE